MIPFHPPKYYVRYNQEAVYLALVEAKAAIQSLKNTPYQRSWVEDLQEMELKREIAGTSRIEGADFTERELDAALNESPEELLTRSQKQARAAKNTYTWIAGLKDDHPITESLIKEIHTHTVTGADDDHCVPGRLRSDDQNVSFGQPRHRGVEGGVPCRELFSAFVNAIRTEFNDHDMLIQAHAAHYHLAAMHPFLDGNGRTARALEALMLQRAGLRDTCFIAMSNYYYDEKTNYLATLNHVRESEHDLTSFLIFSLKGIKIQVTRLMSDIRRNMQKAIFRNVMFDLFNRLLSTRKRVIAERQIEILKLLLQEDSMELVKMRDRLRIHYQTLNTPIPTFSRDIIGLLDLGAIIYKETEDGKFTFKPRLEWPTEITETEFFKKIKQLPKAKTYPFLG